MIAQPIETTTTRRYRPDHPIVALAEFKARRRWLARQNALRAAETPRETKDTGGNATPRPAA